MDAENMVRRIRCGGISHGGTSNGKLRSVGNSTVEVGMIRIRFVFCGWKNAAMSLVLNMMINDVMNIAHSIIMFV